MYICVCICSSLPLWIFLSFFCQDGHPMAGRAHDRAIDWNFVRQVADRCLGLLLAGNQGKPWHECAEKGLVEIRSWIEGESFFFLEELTQPGS